MSYQENKLMNLKDGRLLLETLDVAGRIAGSIAKSDSTEEAVKTLTDGAENLPMEVSVAINPVQDTHGFDPYPAGAGKNKCPLTMEIIKSANTLGTWSGNVYTQANVTFTVLTDDDGNVTGIKANGTPNANIGFYIFKDKTIPAGTYTLTGNPVDATTSHDIWLGTFANDAYRDYDYGTGATVTLSSDTTLSLRFRIASGSQVSNIEIKPMLRLSTESDATFAPYSNVCPISGWDSVEITRTGRNLIDDATFTDGYYISDSGVITESVTFKYSSLIPVEVGKLYRLNGNKVATNSQAKRVHGYNSDGTWVRQLAFTVVGQNITGEYTVDAEIPSDIAYLRISIGNTDTDVTLYEKKDYPVSLPTTTYGGTLTVNRDGSGRLIADKAYDVATTNNVTMRTGGYRFYYNPSAIGNKSNVYGVISDRIPTATETQYINASSTQELFCYINSTSGGFNFNTAKVYDSVSSMIADIEEISFCYELDTPVAIDFTAQQIRSLLGENNVWADSGNVLNVVYSADTKMYIDDQKELPAVTSDDNGKVLRVVDGVWSAVSLPSASGVSF